MDKTLRDESDRMVLSVDVDAPCLICPWCCSGSSALYMETAHLDHWTDITCPRCCRAFIKSHALDEMFIRGLPEAWQLWAAARVYRFIVSCRIGEAQVVRLPEQLSRVYDVTANPIGTTAPYLAGGIAVKHVLQGYVMVAVAPDDVVCASAAGPMLELMLAVVGQTAGDQPLPVWKQLMVEARLVSVTQPALALVLCVSAVDLFVTLVTQERAGTNPPRSWSKRVRALTGADLFRSLGEDWPNAESLCRARNAVAHGKSYRDLLPASVAAKHRFWNDGARHRYDPRDRLAPVALFALRTSLAVIRCIGQMTKARG